MIACLMIKQGNDQSEMVTYEEFSLINTPTLINIAKQIIEENQNIQKEFNETNPNHELFQRLNDTIDNLILAYKKRVAESLQPFAKQIQHIYSSIDFNSIKEVVEQIGGQLNSFSNMILRALPSISKPLIDSLRDYANEIEDRELEVKIMMLEVGWINVIEFDETDILEVLEEVYEGETEDVIQIINGYMLRLYTDENIIDILSKWGQGHSLSKRYPILKKAINAHLRKEYELSVPVFLAQFERIIRDVVPYNFKEKRLTYADIRKYLRRLHETQDRIDLEAIFDRFLKNDIFSSFITGEEFSSDLSRNAILHGVDTEYGTKVNSLKVIFLFDYVQKMLFKVA